MTPQDAIQKLLDRRWTVEQIATAAGMHRATVYRVLNGSIPTYANAISLFEIAKGRPAPPKEKQA